MAITSVEVEGRKEGDKEVAPDWSVEANLQDFALDFDSAVDAQISRGERDK